MTTSYRDDLINGLRELADFLQAHPSLPVSKYGVAKVSYHVGLDIADDDDARNEVDRIAAELGVTPVLRASGTQYLADKIFGGITYRAIAIGKARCARCGEHDVTA